MSCILISFSSQSVARLPSAAINGEPRIDCDLRMWSSSNDCTSSKPAKMYASESLQKAQTKHKSISTGNQKVKKNNFCSPFVGEQWCRHNLPCFIYFVDWHRLTLLITHTPLTPSYIFTCIVSIRIVRLSIPFAYLSVAYSIRILWPLRWRFLVIDRLSAIYQCQSLHSTLETARDLPFDRFHSISAASDGLFSEIYKRFGYTT